MLFHTPTFLFLFLPAACLAWWTTTSRPALRALALPLLGMAFYSFAGLPQLGLLLAMSLVTFAGIGAREAGSPARRALGLCVLLLNLAVLGAFKLAQALQPGSGVMLPLGISFYTFNLVSYGLDVRGGRTRPAPSLASLAAYASFFPTVAAGPLLRFDDFEKQRAAPPRRFDAELLERGLLSLIVGLAKKLLVADPLGAAIEPLFASYERLGMWDAWLAVLGYSYQLYFDFSGYTDMAIGAAALLGFRVPQNFNAPYTAVHIADFWQRWHITMSRWFRDYLFLPLSRSVLRRTESFDDADRVRSACLVLTMLAIGLWHGSTWAFLAWGLYHGLLLAGHAYLRGRLRAVPVWAGRILTFVAVLAGWVLLRSPSPGMALRIWEAMSGLHGWGAAAARGPLSAAVALLLVITNSRLESRLLQPGRSSGQAWALAALLVLSLLSLGGRSPFLYFQF